MATFEGGYQQVDPSVQAQCKMDADPNQCVADNIAEANPKLAELAEMSNTAGIGGPFSAGAVGGVFGKGVLDQIRKFFLPTANPRISQRWAEEASVTPAVTKGGARVVHESPFAGTPNSADPSEYALLFNGSGTMLSRGNGLEAVVHEVRTGAHVDDVVTALVKFAKTTNVVQRTQHNGVTITVRPGDTGEMVAEMIGEAGTIARETVRGIVRKPGKPTLIDGPISDE